MQGFVGTKRELSSRIRDAGIAFECSGGANLYVSDKINRAFIIRVYLCVTLKRAVVQHIKKW